MANRFAITTVDVDLPMLGPQRLRFTDHSDDRSRSTILIGRNGSGKSTILRELAMAFRAYFATSKPNNRQGRDRVNSIAVSVNAQRAVMHLKSSSKDFREERDAITDRDIKPRRMIALSFTPFDKFPPVDDTYRRDPPEADDPFYVYLGFKSESRALSPRARLLRSIDQLAFARTIPRADERVSATFTAIGYMPSIKIAYDIDRVGARRNNDIDELELKNLEMRLLERTYGGSGRRGRVIYEIDFRTTQNDLELPIGFEELQELTRRRILRLASITLRRLDDEPVELLELSSGELNLLSGFLGLAAFIDDGCLVMIDEPENSLHPEWQIQYVAMLETVLRQHQGCHYIIATHSPLIVSGVADSTTKVLRLDQAPIEVSSRVVEDASPDATLLNAFEVVTQGNNFLKQVVLEALTLIETGQHKTQRAHELANFLFPMLEKIPAADPLRELAANVVRAIVSPQ